MTTRKPKQDGSGKRDEIVLKKNTTYQLSVYGVATTPATLYIDFYEHTNKIVI